MIMRMLLMMILVIAGLSKAFSKSKFLIECYMQLYFSLLDWCKIIDRHHFCDVGNSRWSDEIF